MSNTEETTIVRVLVHPGLLLGLIWVAVGKTVAVAKSRATQLLADKHCASAPEVTEPDYSTCYPEPSTEQIEAASQVTEQFLARPASALTEFPNYEQLNKGGLTTTDQLKQYIEDNGAKRWFENLGLTAEEGAAVISHLEATADPAPTGGKKKKS